jgi:hypothetical protein
MRLLKRWWWLLPLILVVVLIGAVFWATRAAGPMPEALAALESDSQVSVSTNPWLVFRPTAGSPYTGLVLYPGGRVDPRSYAPPAREIASEGFLVVVVPMPLNLAVLGVDRATDVMAAFPEVRSWAIGGHSLGGAMAARYAHRSPDSIEGLILWAAYPASGDDLSDHDLAAASIYGTRDGVSTLDEITVSQPLLPPHTSWVPIEGGNHAQFGWYGPQSGDMIATISREEQQQQAVAATVALLSRLVAKVP